jgi:hypothetical protein
VYTAVLVIDRCSNRPRIAQGIMPPVGQAGMTKHVRVRVQLQDKADGPFARSF